MLALCLRHIDIPELVVAEIIVSGIRRIERRLYRRRTGIANGSGREPLSRIGVICIGVLVDEIDVGYGRDILLDIVLCGVTLESAGSLRRILQAVMDDGRNKLHLAVIGGFALDYRGYGQSLVARITKLLCALGVVLCPDVRESVKESAYCDIRTLSLEEIIGGREEIALKSVRSVFAVLYR